MFGGLGNVLFALVVVLSGRSVAGNYDDPDYYPDYPDYPDNGCHFTKSRVYWEHKDIGRSQHFGSQLEAETECNKYDTCIAIACENANPGHCYLVKEKGNEGAIEHDKWTWFDRECEDGLVDDHLILKIGTWTLCVNLDAEGGCKSDNTINPPGIGGPPATRTPPTSRPPGNKYDPAKCCKSKGVPTMCIGICDCVDSTPPTFHGDIGWGRCGQYAHKIETCQKKCTTTGGSTVSTTRPSTTKRPATPPATPKCRPNEKKNASRKMCEQNKRTWKCKEDKGCRRVCCPKPPVANDPFYDPYEDPYEVNDNTANEYDDY